MANQSRPLSNMELSAFAEQMTMILTSGISVIEGLSILLEDAETEAERSLLSQMNDEMLTTGSLYEALKITSVFPAYMLQMVHIGEETGTLDEVMKSLAIHYEREEDIAKSMKTALTYPLIMIFMMFLVIIVLITKVMPVFQQVFTQLGREMSGISGGILALGSTLSKYAFVFLGLFVLLVLLLFYFTKTSSGRAHLQRIGYHIPFAKDLSHKICACRFAGGMSLMLKSGMTPERSLEFVVSLMDNPDFVRKIDRCNGLLLQGADLAEALYETKIFTGIYARMSSLAGKAGKMDEIMEQIAVQYEAEVDAKLSSFISVLEPTLVIILSFIVGVVLLSVMLPLMGIMAGL